MATMNVFSAATGLNCTDCHTEESGGDWAKYADDNALKQRARAMVVMMNTINRTNFGGRQVVTCVTCHRGVSRPTVMPSLDLLYSELPPEDPGDIIAPAPRQPSADQMFDRHIAAAGGDARFSDVTAVAGTGTFVGFDEAEKTPFDLAARAPGQRRTTAGGAVVTLCFDQETGLLTRFIRFSQSPVGRVVTRVDYGDYRDVDGMKFPFAWTVTWLGGRSGYQLASLEPNSTLPANIFSREHAVFRCIMGE